MFNSSTLRIRIPPLRTGGATPAATPAETPRPMNGTPEFNSLRFNPALVTDRPEYYPFDHLGPLEPPTSPAYSPTSPPATPRPRNGTPVYTNDSPAYSPTSPPYDPPLMDLEPLDRRAGNGTPVYTNDSPAYSPTSPPYDPFSNLEPLDPFRELEPLDPILEPILDQLIPDSVQDSEVQYVRTVRASQRQRSVTMRATSNQWREIMSAAEGARCPLCLEDLNSMTEMAELSCTYDAETGGKHFMCTTCAETMHEMHEKKQETDPRAKLKCYTCAQEVSTVYVKWVERKRPRPDSDEESRDDKRSRVV